MAQLQATETVKPSAVEAVDVSAATLALSELVRALARRQARIDSAKLVAANDNVRPN